MPTISMQIFSISKTTSHGHPNLVALICVSPGTNISMHGIRPCSTLTQKLNNYELLTLIRPSAMRLDATIFIPHIPAVSNAQLLSTFLTFSAYHPPSLIYHLSYHLIFYRPSLVARSTPSEAPKPLYTSTHVVAAAHIAVAEICLPEKKAWQIPKLRNTAPAPSNHHQRHRRHDGLRNGMRDAIAHQQ